MTRIPNNVIKPPKGYEYVQRRSVPIVQIERTTQPDDTKVRINYLESKLDKIMDELRVLKRRDKYKTCLLYTSPSPRDGLLSRMPSSA